MGMAAYGQPRYQEQLRSLLKLDEERCTADVIDVRRLAGAETADELRQCLDLYRGDLLEPPAKLLIKTKYNLERPAPPGEDDESRRACSPRKFVALGSTEVLDFSGFLEERPQGAYFMI